MSNEHGGVRLLDHTISRSIHRATVAPQQVVTSRKWWIATALCLLPLCLNLVLSWQWSLDDDEFYTLRDSRQPIRVILTYHKPLYYLIVHYALQLPLPEEFTIRLPAAIAGSLIAPTFYLMLTGIARGRTPLYTAVLAVTNPWIFDYSQFGRFYTLMFLLTALASLSLYRWILLRRHYWLLGYIAAAAGATLAHTTAVVILPAGLAAVGTYFAIAQPEETRRLLYRHGWTIFAAILALGAVCLWMLHGVLIEWLSSRHGKFGGYPMLTLVRAVIGLGGLQVWALAFLPLANARREGRPEKYFLAAMILGSIVPYIFLAPVGGGIASRYLMQALPCLFVLGGIHWDVVSRQLPSASYRLALAGTILALYLPYDLSNLKDGNHCNYRQAVTFVESLELQNPLIASTSHHLYKYYAKPAADVQELGFLADLSGGKTDASSKPGRAILNLIDQAEQTGRPLILVSRQFWEQPDDEANRWLGERFATLSIIETPRFDHRRNQLVILEYRPTQRLTTQTANHGRREASFLAATH